MLRRITSSPQNKAYSRCLVKYKCIRYELVVSKERRLKLFEERLLGKILVMEPEGQKVSGL
jgi:hypothetical protein